MSQDRGIDMMMQEGIKCYHCGKGFYLNGYRMHVAKTVACMHCGKRIIKFKADDYDG